MSLLKSNQPRQVQSCMNQATKTKADLPPRSVEIIFYHDANLLQIRFPECPHDIIRRELKSSGFRWVPDEGVWQRFRSNEATAEACRIAQIFVDHQRPHMKT